MSDHVYGSELNGLKRSTPEMESEVELSDSVLEVGGKDSRKRGFHKFYEIHKKTSTYLPILNLSSNKLTTQTEVC